MPNNMTPEGALALRRRIDGTGIGYAGIDGLWWLPACESFKLPKSMRNYLEACARAVFTLIDVIAELYRCGTCRELNRLLTHKVPPQLLSCADNGRVQSLRPDFQLQSFPGGDIRPVITELELCPSSHGFAHAMQVGYELETDLVRKFAHLLGGRELLFAGTVQWSPFIFEQLAFCQALAAVDGKGWVLYNEPIAQIASSAQRGEIWRPPMFGVDRKPAHWDLDIAGRIFANHQQQYLWPAEGGWPDEVGEAVVFRFGYLNCFSRSERDSFARWQQNGATFLNPATFYLDSKVVMAALSIPFVREEISRKCADALHTLAWCLPETLLLERDQLSRLSREKDQWVVKYAGFDDDNQAWGGRSLRIGEAFTQTEWEVSLTRALDHPWPVVAQRNIPSMKIDITYLDKSGRVRKMTDSSTRLRAFFLRTDNEVDVCGVHLTASNEAAQVSEGIGAVQAPVIYV